MTNSTTTLKKKNYLTYLFYLIGVIILSFGITVTIVSNFGAGSWDALNVGLSNTIGLSVGNWVILVGILLLIASSIIERKALKITSLLTSFIIGIFIDIWMVVLNSITTDTYLLKFILFIIGIIITSFGLSLIIFAKLPPGPIDYFALAIKDRFNLSIGQAKTISEGIGLILAIIFKGPVGLGTLLTMFIIGPCIQFFNKLLHPILLKISK